MPTYSKVFQLQKPDGQEVIVEIKLIHNESDSTIKLFAVDSDGKVWDLTISEAYNAARYRELIQYCPSLDGLIFTYDEYEHERLIIENINMPMRNLRIYSDTFGYAGQVYEHLRIIFSEYLASKVANDFVLK